VATEEDVRRIALSLPETTEERWYGTPGFKVRGKGFLRYRNEPDGGLVVFVPDLFEKEAMLRAEPKKFFTTPHYDGSAAVLVNVKAMGVRQLREVITESWCQKAPPKVLALFEEGFGKEARPAP
jgi:hypothetical protein